MKFLLKDNTIFYVAETAENPSPVYFKLTNIGTRSFVSENPDHDYPKKIAYKLDGDRLLAKISGNGRVAKFGFKRK